MFTRLNLHLKGCVTIVERRVYVNEKFGTPIFFLLDFYDALLYNKGAKQ